MSYRDELDAAGDEIEARIPGLRVLGMGGGCPFQAEGATPDGEEFYFRYRHDEATLYVFPGGASHLQARLYAEEQDAMGVYDGGTLSGPEAAGLFVRLWGQLKPRAAFGSTGAERLSMQVKALTEAMRASREPSARE